MLFFCVCVHDSTRRITLIMGGYWCEMVSKCYSKRFKGVILRISQYYFNNWKKPIKSKEKKLAKFTIWVHLTLIIQSRKTWNFSERKFHLVGTLGRFFFLNFSPVFRIIEKNKRKNCKNFDRDRNRTILHCIGIYGIFSRNLLSTSGFKFKMPIPCVSPI